MTEEMHCDCGECEECDEMSDEEKEAFVEKISEFEERIFSYMMEEFMKEDDIDFHDMFLILTDILGRYYADSFNLAYEFGQNDAKSTELQEESEEEGRKIDEKLKDEIEELTK